MAAIRGADDLRDLLNQSEPLRRPAQSASSAMAA
jgi:hypothetical protein